MNISEERGIRLNKLSMCLFLLVLFLSFTFICFVSANISNNYVDNNFNDKNVGIQTCKWKNCSSSIEQKRIGKVSEWIKI